MTLLMLMVCGLTFVSSFGCHSRYCIVKYCSILQGSSTRELASGLPPSRIIPGMSQVCAMSVPCPSRTSPGMPNVPDFKVKSTRCTTAPPVGLALDLEDYHPSVLLHCWLGHVTCKIVSEMTYNVSSGTLNPTIPYHRTTRVCRYNSVIHF